MARLPDSDLRRWWRGIVERQPLSGLTVADYCAANDVSTASFYQWRKKFATELGEASDSSDDALGELDAASDSSDDAFGEPDDAFVAPAMIRVKVTPSSNTPSSNTQEQARFRFSGGVVLELPSGDTSAIAAVVKELLGRSEAYDS